MFNGGIHWDGNHGNPPAQITSVFSSQMEAFSQSQKERERKMYAIVAHKPGVCYLKRGNIGSLFGCILKSLTVSY